jgi:disulfide oxidoreductase YuzD
VKKIKAALLGKPKVMENQIHFKSENEIPEWLQEIFNTEEKYDEAMSDYEYIIERRLEQRENENNTANQERF